MTSSIPTAGPFRPQHNELQLRPLNTYSQSHLNSDWCLGICTPQHILDAVVTRSSRSWAWIDFHGSRQQWKEPWVGGRSLRFSLLSYRLARPPFPQHTFTRHLLYVGVVPSARVAVLKGRQGLFPGRAPHLLSSPRGRQLCELLWSESLSHLALSPLLWHYWTIPGAWWGAPF